MCRVIQDLTVLFNVSRALQERLSLKEAIVPVFRVMAEHMGMERGFITIRNRESEEMIIDEAHGMSAREKRQGRYRLGEGIVGQVVASGEPTCVPDIHASEHFLDRTDALKHFNPGPARMTAFLCAPIMTGGEVIGTLGFFRNVPRDISPSLFNSDLRLLNMIAAQITLAVQLRQKSAEEMETLLIENEKLHQEIRADWQPTKLIGNSNAMRGVYYQVAQVGPSLATVLIRGESGVGKELAAHAVYESSSRKEKPYVAVNCAGLPETLIESELFGHERGAFTGAVSLRKGRFESAAGGTLFLDEIGELSLSSQAKLLRVLQEGTFERVGGAETIQSDVRLIAATNRDLEAMIAEGEFRQDLYYRLNVFPIHIPPLRDRKCDILPLADHFLEKYAKRNGKAVRRISTPAIDMLTSYHWPGNVRELENVMERAVILSTDDVIHSYHLPASLQTGQSSQTESQRTLQEALDEVEREMIVESLKATSGNMAASARQLGITERQMGVRVKRHQLDYNRFRAHGSGAA